MKYPLPKRTALLAALSLLLLPAIHAQNDSSIRVVRLSRAEGQVLVSHAGSDTWDEAPVNLPLQEGDSLATQDGLAAIEFENGATGYLAENSVLQFSQLRFSSVGRATELTLTQGAGTFYANLTAQDTFRLRTSILDVAIPARAEVRIDAFRDGAAAEVFTGNVSVSTTKGSTDLVKGQSVAVHENDFKEMSVGSLPTAEDAFDQWVTQQGEIIRSGNKNTLTYIHSPNSYGLSDLSIYGTWINLTGYGPSWRPFSVGLTWTPYFNGIWRLDSLLGWVWVSGEPWGWTPYHFGTWLLSPSVGWVWVPGGPAGLAQWQPSRVNWVRSGNQIGWVPMSPEDREGAAANAAHGVITQPTRSTKNENEHNEIMAAKDLRGVTSLKQPPQEFATGFAPSGAQQGIRSTVRVAPPSNTKTNESIVLDRQTHTFINRDPRDGTVSSRPQNPPVAPAALMPRSGSTEIPRVTKPLPAPEVPRVNRVILPPPFPARPSTSIPPIAQPRTVAPPLVVQPPFNPRPVAPAPMPARPAVPPAPAQTPAPPHTAPGQQLGSVPRPAPQEPKPASQDRR